MKILEDDLPQGILLIEEALLGLDELEDLANHQHPHLLYCVQRQDQLRKLIAEASPTP